ncbi:calcium/sodium antiporter [Sedimentisphaera salicampi]|uniref:Inner membrane protein YrbG n=1 Tax=Sedimentisphaera salicampi TaxID=1941349 RepID=A0A1W6LJL8_9BACT|nr:calcium/sodium antiporter [Sedimentisphaera salicampi]ARN55990.1 Inner membrane protein YrbG [Sedimentisphaera salicampi]OXU15904.1 Inner membrane protein YrbG [Sedimentisphaera salicampi]
MDFHLILALLANIAGVYMLCKGADMLVESSVSLAKKAGVSTFVVGLTVVSIGTSAPEVASSTAAAVKGAGSAALGNIFGSNIANIALIGGISSLIRPMTVSRRVSRIEMPAMNIIVLLMLAFLWNCYISRIEGLFMLSAFIILLYLVVYEAHKGRKIAALEPVPKTQMPLRKSIIILAAGLVFLIGGAKLALEGAVYIGRAIGISEAVIGLIVLAIGTSLPELITCVTAALKGHENISVGNLIGSNIFNALLVTGVASSVSPFSFEARLKGADYLLVLATGIIFQIFAVRGGKISRPNGAFLLLVYIAYTAYCFIHG